MQIKTDENGYVTGYATLGGISGSVEYSGEIPQDFQENCRFYKFVGGVFTFDTLKKETLEAKETAIIRIDELKCLLAESDYKAIKFFEGYIAEEEYSPIKAQREAWREEIRGLEALIDG